MLITGGHKPVQAVIFDLGRVLVTVEFDRLLQNPALCERVDKDALSMERITRLPFFKPLMEGRITPRAFLAEFNAHFGTALSYEEFTRLWCAIFGLEPGMRAVLEAFRARYPVTLLSDVDPMHWEYLTRTYPWLQKIPRPVLSFQSGYMKPHPMCYTLAAQAVDTSPENCLFIDDRPPNVAGACAVGMQAVLFKGVALLRRSLTCFEWARGAVDI